MVVGIVLAAGKSLRMGRPKALLKVGRTTFIRRIIDNLGLAGVRNIVVVLGANAEEIRKEIENSNVTVVINENFAAGQLSSLQKGIECARSLNPEAILIHPVDHPLVSHEVIDLLQGTFARRSCLAVVPVHKGRRGHPVIVSARLFDELMNASPDVGARVVMWKHAHDVIELETSNEGVIIDVDTPQDYSSLPESLVL